MPILTASNDQQYHDTPSLWGNSQFMTLQNIIDNIALTSGDDSYFKKVNSHRAIIHGKMGLKKLNVDLKVSSKAIKFDLGPQRTFPFPRYMTNWYRCSVVNDCGKLEMLDINNLPTINDYLQDHNYELIYDNNGEIMQANDFNPKVGDCKLTFECPALEPECAKYKDESIYVNSWVRANKEGNYFEFSDDLVDKQIVIEFETAGLDVIDACDVKVLNNLELTLTYWIKWKLLEGDRNAPLSRIEYFHREYKSELKRSRRLLSDKVSIKGILKACSLRYN